MQLENLKVNSDARGSFVEAFKLPSDGQVSYIIANPGQTRGNHYHLRKTETFLVIYGSAEMAVRDRETGNVMHAIANGTRPLSIKIVPNHTHAVTATSEGAVILVWCDEQFNEKDPDTYPEEI